MRLEIKILFAVLLTGSAVRDLQKRTVSAGLCIVIGSLAVGMQWFVQGGWKILELLPGAGIGAVILLLHVLTEGAVGDGDGWFFVVTGILLGFWGNLILLFYGLLCCCAGGGLWMTWNRLTGKKATLRRMRLPFIPFLAPAGIWLLFQ